jgi:protein TonB
LRAFLEGIGGRFLKLSAAAAAITFGLFWLMQALIGTEGELKEGGASPSVDFVRLKRDSEPEAKKRELPRKKPPEQPPPPPQMNFAKNLKPDDAVGGIVPMVDSSLELSEATNLGAGGSDRDVVPLVRVEPQYPMQAAQRGIEGWVELAFTISTAGTVKDARVTKAHPRRIFDKAALTAVRKWKYNPKVENGSPVERNGVQVRLAFRLPR